MSTGEGPPVADMAGDVGDLAVHDVVTCFEDEAADLERFALVDQPRSPAGWASSVGRARGSPARTGNRARAPALTAAPSSDTMRAA
jgi:hypothetical protein